MPHARGRRGNPRGSFVPKAESTPKPGEGCCTPNIQKPMPDKPHIIAPKPLPATSKRES